MCIISLATVYRNLNTMADHGLIGKSLPAGGADRFDKETHLHRSYDLYLLWGRDRSAAGALAADLCRDRGKKQALRQRVIGSSSMDFAVSVSRHSRRRTQYEQLEGTKTKENLEAAYREKLKYAVAMRITRRRRKRKGMNRLQGCSSKLLNITRNMPGSGSSCSTTALEIPRKMYGRLCKRSGSYGPSSIWHMLSRQRKRDLIRSLRCLRAWRPYPKCRSVDLPIWNRRWKRKASLQGRKRSGGFAETADLSKRGCRHRCNARSAHSRRHIFSQ